MRCKVENLCVCFHWWNEELPEYHSFSFSFKWCTFSSMHRSPFHQVNSSLEGKPQKQKQENFSVMVKSNIFFFSSEKKKFFMRSSTTVSSMVKNFPLIDATSPRILRNVGSREGCCIHLFHFPLTFPSPFSIDIKIYSESTQ